MSIEEKKIERKEETVNSQNRLNIEELVGSARIVIKEAFQLITGRTGNFWDLPPYRKQEEKIDNPDH